MAKGVFITKVSPSYDDLPELRYHFPRTYLHKAQEIVGDWILYYEPRREGPNESGRAGRSSYFATAKVERIEPDSNRPDHHYAVVSNYLEFDRVVPFKTGDHYWESSLRRPDGQTNKGQFRRSVRTLPQREYDLIVLQGFEGLDLRLDAVAEEESESITREIVTTLVERPFRDKKFAEHVTKAYDARCAFTGIRIVNGGGRAEVEAAHIRPVAGGHNGTDSIRNGLALSRTMHWMFDRGLLSIGTDLSILVAKADIPREVVSLINATRRLRLPSDVLAQPHPQFLRYHREKIFKGAA
jgi:putative restriction endonuclease